MTFTPSALPRAIRTSLNRLALLSLAAGLVGLSGCSSSYSSTSGTGTMAAAPAPARMMGTARPPSPDPRIGLEPGLFDAEEAIWNLRLVSATPPSTEFVGVTNSDLAFTGPYAIQGNYNGI